MIGLIGLAAWALSHAYAGIFHDAGLYTLQALARLHPDSLPQDVFLKFGSQDRFTLFSPLYAAAARWLGIETAAAALTLLLQGALIAAAWTLARSVLPRAPSLLGLAVLIAIPGDYGADRIFTCIEPFLTPRMAAEALVLGGLAAALTERRRLAVVLSLVALLLHPVMGMAGVFALACLAVPKPRPLIAIALAVVAVKALVLWTLFMPPGQWGRFDAVWLGLVAGRSPYLFMAHWPIDDWSRAAVTVVTLAVGARVLADERARTLARTAAAVVVTGMALTLLAGDLLHLVLFTQLQTWRWQWLGTAVAALLLPQIVRTLWSDAETGRRTAALLLIAAWLFAANAYALVASAAALAALFSLHRLKPDEARWVRLGAWGLLSIAVVWRLAVNLEFTDAYYLDPNIPLWTRRAASFVHDGAAPAAAAALAFWLSRQRRGVPALLMLGGLAAAACAAALPSTWHSWTAHDYSPQQIARFSGFRDRIPPGSNVFWPESPVAAWVLLQRPSYLSVLQTSGMVFSRSTARELERRAAALGTAINPASFLGWNSGTAMLLSPGQLERTCATGEFPYLVTGNDLGVEPLAELPSASGPAAGKIRLYRCPLPGPSPNS